MKTETLTVRISREDKNRLDTLAKVMERSKAYLVGEAIEDFLQAHEWEIRAIKAGLQAADRGEFASDQEVRGVLDKWMRSVED